MLSMRPPPLAMTTVMYIAITSVIARKMALFAIWRASPTVLHPGAEVLRELADITLCQLIRDRKSTRLNSSHQIISYAVFCLKKKIPPRDTDRGDQLLHSPVPIDSADVDEG